MRILLTHSEGRLEGLAAALARRGHDVRHHPLVCTRAREGEAVRAEAEALLGLPWLMFTSRSAVEAWRALGLPWRRQGLPPDESAPLLAAVGRKTAADLRRAGAEVALTGERSQAASLADDFLAHPRAAGPVGLPQGDRALPTLRRALEQAGFETRPLVLYETVVAQAADELLAAPATTTADTAATTEATTAATTAATTTAATTAAATAATVVVLASPSAAGALPESVARSATLVAIGPTTAAAVEARGFGCRRAASPSVAGVLATVDAMTADATAADGTTPDGMTADTVTSGGKAPASKRGGQP